MIASEYTKYLLVAVTDRAIGDQVAAIVGNEPGDAHTFDRAIPAYPVGTTFTPMQDGPITLQQASNPPARWVTGVAVKQDAHDVAAEFAAGGYPATLVSAGLTHEQIDALIRPAVHVVAGERTALEGTIQSFVNSLELVLAP